ncbi:threonine/serine ThrE exporter family protein [Rothia nasisuis]|uniref:threonine/serine ThrE exporter family protein n=1 Tax=Rothia nasisuis TaxID=2109647 RepID=UPI001F235707|nr:threonine/serine exporter family protein [Rothia nasisuis]
MSKSSAPLQQKAYPSASAFDIASSADEASVGAFGQTALLPRVSSGTPGQKQQDATAPPTGGAAGGERGGIQNPPAASTGSSWGPVPVISLDEVRDPRLRDALAHLGESAPPTPENSAFDLSAPATYQVPSAFGPATDLTLGAAAEPDSAPTTAGNPTVDEATGLQQASYPSASGPHTVNLPVAPPAASDAKRPSRVRSSLKSFVSTDQSLTKPMRGIARLAQRPFNIAAAHRAAYVREKEEAREVLNFSLRLAETMFHYGADTVDVDSAIVAVCAAYGLDDVEIDITNQSVIINYVSDIDEVDDQTRAISLDGSTEAGAGKERFSHTVMRVVRSWSENYAALDDIYKLINDITAGGLPRHRAERRLHKINTAKKPYSPMVIMLANIVAAFSLVLALGGSLAAGAVGGIVFLAIHFVNSLISRLKMPGFFTMAAGAGVVTFAAIYISDEASLFSQVGFHVSAPHIVAAGLIMLLPTARLVSTVQDALNGFPLTAAGKFVSTGMSFLGIVVGLASAVAALSVLGVSELDITETRFVGATPVVSYIFFMLASLAFAVTTHARWRTLLWILLISTCGFAAYQGYTLFFGAGAGRANTAFAALVIGLMSTFLAFRLHAPASIFYVPALTFLLPGLSVFRGLYLFTVEANSATGVPGMVAAIAVILSMASGVVLGSYLMQYIIQRYLATAVSGTDSKEKRDR